jgi:hypothetical protein
MAKTFDASGQYRNRRNSGPQDAVPCRISAGPPRHVSLLDIDRGDLDADPVQPQVELWGATSALERPINGILFGNLM